MRVLSTVLAVVCVLCAIAHASAANLRRDLALQPKLESQSLNPAGGAWTPPGANSNDPVKIAAAILNDNKRRINQSPIGYSKKLERLASDAFPFFRGTTPQYYRRYFTEVPASLSKAPKAIVHADLHVENFGVIKADDGSGLSYGVDDFDENNEGAVSVDLVRCMASINIAYRPNDDKLYKSFLDGYKKGTDGKFHLDSKPIKKFIEDQAKVKAKDVLGKKTKLDGKKRTMIVDPAKNLQVPEADKALAIAALKSSKLATLPSNIHDVIHRFGGTASLDLTRLEFAAGNGDDNDIIIEMKEMLDSVLTPYVGKKANFDRVKKGMSAWQKRPLPIATAKYKGQDMLIRIRPFYGGAIAPLEVSNGDRVEFVHDLGKLVGYNHAKTAVGGGAALKAFVEKNEAELISFTKKMAAYSLSDFEAFKPAAAAAIKAIQPKVQAQLKALSEAVAQRTIAANAAATAAPVVVSKGKPKDLTKDKKKKKL